MGLLDMSYSQSPATGHPREPELEALGVVSQTMFKGEQCGESVSGAESTKLEDEEVRFERLSELAFGLFHYEWSSTDFEDRMSYDLPATQYTFRAHPSSQPNSG